MWPEWLYDLECFEEVEDLVWSELDLLGLIDVVVFLLEWLELVVWCDKREDVDRIEELSWCGLCVLCRVEVVEFVVEMVEFPVKLMDDVVWLVERVPCVLRLVEVEVFDVDLDVEVLSIGPQEINEIPKKERRRVVLKFFMVMKVEA